MANDEDFQVAGEIDMDYRGRVSLGRYGIKGPQRYQVEIGSIGEVRLVPMVSIPKSAASQLNNEVC